MKEKKFPQNTENSISIFIYLFAKHLNNKKK